MPGGFINGGFNIGRAVFPVPFGAFLLDTFSGAAAAYSLEKLASSTSNVVRVRRSSDDTEQDFTAAEVSGGTLTTFTGAGDGFVTTWYDQSGNGRNATQATAASQPQIVSAGDLVAGGLDFDGSDDGLSALFGSLNQPNEYYLVASGDDASGFDIYFDSETTTSRNAVYTDSSGNLAYTAGTNTMSTQVVSGQWLATALFNGASSTLRYNGTEVAVSNPGAGQLRDGLRIGNSNGSSVVNGNINALIVYPSDQSANRAAIEAKLAEIYGITLA